MKILNTLSDASRKFWAFLSNSTARWRISLKIDDFGRNLALDRRFERVRKQTCCLARVHVTPVYVIKKMRTEKSNRETKTGMKARESSILCIYFWAKVLVARVRRHHIDALRGLITRTWPIQQTFRWLTDNLPKWRFMSRLEFFRRNRLVKFSPISPT